MAKGKENVNVEKILGALKDVFNPKEKKEKGAFKNEKYVMVFEQPVVKDNDGEAIEPTERFAVQPGFYTLEEIKDTAVALISAGTKVHAFEYVGRVKIVVPTEVVNDNDKKKKKSKKVED